jgi:hypothetical protein
MQKHTTGLDELKRERQGLEGKADRLADAVAEMGHSPALLAKLREVDDQIAVLDQRINEHKPLDLTTTVAEMREFVLQNVMQLRSLLREDASKSKAALARHIGQLKLTRRETQDGPQYEVSGAVELLNTNYVMPVVARDGYPLYTTLLVPLVDLYLDPRGEPGAVSP